MCINFICSVSVTVFFISYFYRKSNEYFKINNNTLALPIFNKSPDSSNTGYTVAMHHAGMTIEMRLNIKTQL